MYAEALKTPVSIDERSRFVFVSDCHRGSGGWADDFSHNNMIFLHAIQHYLERGFTLVEAGDGEELWQNSFEDIHWAYGSVYSRMGSFHAEGRLMKIWGNHDNAWRSSRTFARSFLPALWRKSDGRLHPLLAGLDPPASPAAGAPSRSSEPAHPILAPLEAREGVVLRHGPTGADILVIHGHQGEFWSESVWMLSRFLVHSIWRRLQSAGLRVRSSPAGNYALRAGSEGKLRRWARREGILVISGHTHQPSFPLPGGTPCFNCGSCIHPNCITCIELCDDTLSLVKWGLTTSGAEGAASDGDKVELRRTILQGPEPLAGYIPAKSPAETGERCPPR